MKRHYCLAKKSQRLLFPTMDKMTRIMDFVAELKRPVVTAGGDRGCAIGSG
jgi:hypothetical protein